MRKEKDQPHALVQSSKTYIYSVLICSDVIATKIRYLNFNLNSSFMHRMDLKKSGWIMIWMLHKVMFIIISSLTIVQVVYAIDRFLQINILYAVYCWLQPLFYLPLPWQFFCRSRVSLLANSNIVILTLFGQAVGNRVCCI